MALRRRRETRWMRSDCLAADRRVSAVNTFDALSGMRDAIFPPCSIPILWRFKTSPTDTRLEACCGFEILAGFIKPDSVTRDCGAVLL